MSKIDVIDRKQAIPPEYISVLKPGCRSWEQVLKVIPVTTSFTAGTTPTKTFLELPSCNFRLSEFYIECSVTVTFSSNSGSDVYSTVQPSIVQWATSLINQARFISGSTEILNLRNVNLRYAWEQNIMSNSITRNAETSNNVSPTAYTAATPQLFRFPLTALSNDFFSLDSGIWPGSYARKPTLELYWEAPANCIYAAGTIAGTVFSFGYTVNSWSASIVQVTDPNIDNLISTRGYILNHQNWWVYQQSITTAPTQTIQIPVSFASVCGVVWGVQKVSDITSNTNAGKLALMSSELTNLVSLDLRLNSQLRQQDKFVDVNQEAIPETRRMFPIAKYSDFYNNLTLNNTTHQMLAQLAQACYCTSCLSGLNTASVSSGMWLEFQLTSALSSASIITVFVVHNRSISVSVSPNGTGNLFIDE
jgi:hypothetical protein